MGILPENFKTTHIGSLPFFEAEKAVKLVFEYLDIPAWPQLSKRKNEGMLVQFNEGLPGFNWEKECLDTSSPEFEEQMLNFYETYLKILEENQLNELAKFELTEATSLGFKVFLEIASEVNPRLVKGQITGPFTLASGLKLHTGESPIFKDELKDLIVKFVFLKALAQGLKLKKVAPIVIIFLDEPGLAGFGSSSFITITKEEVLNMLNEIALGLKNFNLLTGIHICANTSWDLPLNSEIDILSFDSFNFYEKLSIYAEDIKNFLKKEDKYLAWGVVPTDSAQLKEVSFEEILNRFKVQLKDLANKTGFAEQEILKRSLFTPACGLGSLPEDLALKALDWLKQFKKALNL
ncbi:hypothetical protein F1847_04900 [Thermodesulfobacterium sp. TA1]|uniref:hypothetical protein n=1 Tax=Thermodesulfobacterium sp. TA1 TaxID=2234087 RepID=UPI001231E9D7|nr:hypothetical protein [Thermodesulfobacterium sp. TA1]QER42114.1 hypothetical protein F1847_04900 [Thermodesulfobacterium sp. TA1]